MKNFNNPKPILYAEDDENDVFLLHRAFRQVGIAERLQVVINGQLAIDYLSGTTPYDDRVKYPLPCLVLLDLKMPGKSGLEVLRWMRTHPQVGTFPALILTSSNQQSDIASAYQLGANGYLIKPGRPDELTAMVKGIHDYWLIQNCMPES
jgi:CheY-like chemotaxis protein